MRAGLTTSVVLHAAVLGFGLLTLSAPRAFEVQDVEAFPVDIVPIEDVPQSVLGEKKAPAAEKPAPRPTQRPDIVPEAQKVGNNSVDTDTKPTPEAKPRPVEAASPPPPAPEPTPKPAEPPKPEPVKQPEPKPTPTPATEVTPQPEPKQDVKPDPVAETIAAESPDAEAVKLPDTAPSPASKPQPQPPQAQTAKTPDRKEPEKPVKQAAAATPKSDEKSFNADDISALLNKEKASGGGAKRSTEQAAMGAKKTTGQQLSQSDKAALASQLGGCWNIPVGGTDSESLKVSIRFKVTEAGKLDGRPTIETSSGNRSFDESAVRAVQKCDSQGLMLPPATQEWDQFVINFDPAEMF
jgi:colicin import membrane protein